MAWTVLYAHYRQLAQTARDRRLVHYAVRIVLPALMGIPWILASLGHRLPFAVELLIFVVAGLAVRVFLQRALKRERAGTRE